MSTDADLLRRYAAEKSSDAFAELVQRHLPLVYSAALRRLGGDAHGAEDVAQEVFCALARNAQRLSRHPALTGWLYVATRNEVTTLIRAQSRRRARETEAHHMQPTAFEPEQPVDWSRLRPVLDTAMDELGDTDREAVLLRFFQGRAFAEIGAALGLSEDAARKRVDRALDKLRGRLSRHRIASTSAVLAALLAGETASAAPAGLAASITGTAVGAGAMAGGVAVVALTKWQMGLAAAVLVAGAAGLIKQQRTLAAWAETSAADRQTIARLAEEGVAQRRQRAEADAELARLRAEVGRLQARPTSAPADATREPARLTAPAAAPTTSAAPPPASTSHSRPPPQKSDLHRRYDPFLARHGLGPAAMDRFVELKIAIYDVQDDLQGATRQAGAQGGSAGVEAMRAQLTKPLWDEIRQLLGPSAYREYGAYEASSFYRGAYVEPLLPLFAAAQAPLSTEQGDALAGVFAANHTSVRVNPTDISTTNSVNWDAVAAQAAAVLAPEQLAVLQAHVARRKPSGR